VTTGERAPGVGVVVDCDVLRGHSGRRGARAGAQALVLVRVFSEPIGLLCETLSASGLDPHELAGAITRELEPQLRERMEDWA